MLWTVAAMAAPTWTPLQSPEAFLVAEVSGDGGRVCARSRDGRVACWGNQFMWGEFIWKPATAVPHVLQGIDDAADIAVGGALYILRKDGTVTWVRDTRTLTLPGFEDIAEIEQAYNGVCGRTNAGDVLCHGWVQWAKTEEERALAAPLKGATDLACGPWGCCGRVDSKLTCFGDNERLGFGKRPKPAPVQAEGPVSIAAGFACAGTRCWGSIPTRETWKPKGQVFPDDQEPCWLEGTTLTCDRYEDSWSVDGVADVARGQYAQCVISPEGGLSCWGSNEYGSLGDGRPLHRTEPAPVEGLTAQRITAANRHTCAVDGTELKCWGANRGSAFPVGAAPATAARAQYAASCGALSCREPMNDGSYDTQSLRTPSGTTATAIDRARNVCVLVMGALQCRYSLGEGGSDDEWRTVESPPLAELAPMAVGFVLRASDGSVWMLDDDRFDGDADFVDPPVGKQKARALGGRVATAITAHQNGGCAITAAGVECWGGIGSAYDFAPRKRTTIPGFSGATQISGNHFHVCGVVGREVRCFGDNEYGQLGYPTEGDGSTEARPVPLPGPAAEVAVGADHTCARLEDGRVFCWGRDHAGQLGQGRPIQAKRPIPTALGPR